MLARIAACACFVIALGLSQPAWAQGVDRIAAVVNDEIVTLQELEGRVLMALAFSGIPDSLDARRRVAPQVLRKLIDERLQMQEAARLKINLSPAEVEQGIAIIEQQNRMPKGALLGGLARAGVDTRLARDQIRADLTWLRVSARVLQPQVRVGDEEVNDRLETIKERQGRPEYLVSEITLPVDNLAQEDETRTLGERLLEQLKSGAPFAALARQFSRAPTAGNGGSMGWMSEGSLDDELAAPLASLSKGQHTPLIRTSSGFSILMLADSRIAGQVANPEDAVVTLSQIVLPVPTGRDAPPKQELLGRAAQLTANARTCRDLEDVGHRLGSPVAGSLGTKRVGELEAGLRRTVAGLPVNRPSQPMDTASGVQVIMVCSREESTRIALPSTEQVRRVIEDERMDMLARRYIRNLRRSAFIDVRS